VSDSKAIKAIKANTSPLHFAASTGNVEQLKKILKRRQVSDGRGLSQLIDAGDTRQWTALHVACAGNHVQCVDLLIKARCDTTLRNDTGLTALELAESLRRDEAVARLREKLLF
jgi:ankyrin repeat protein